MNGKTAALLIVCFAYMIVVRILYAYRPTAIPRGRKRISPRFAAR